MLGCAQRPRHDIVAQEADIKAIAKFDIALDPLDLGAPGSEPMKSAPIQMPDNGMPDCAEDIAETLKALLIASKFVLQILADRCNR
jgi:hypothetical protein